MHVGNDIVDLLSPGVAGRSRDTKFIRRVLTPAEQDIVAGSLRPDNLLQVYWAAKETAYKAVAKSDPAVTSAPRRYRVFLHMPDNANNGRGYVKTPLADVFFTVQQQKGFVHCFGATPSPDRKKLVSGVENISGRTALDFYASSRAVSRMTRVLAGKTIAAMLSVDADNILITRTDIRDGTAFPRVFLDMEETDIDISLSHDGRFIAYALAF